MTLRTYDLNKIAAALDGARGATGRPLSAEARALVFAVMDDTAGPDWATERMKRWEKARGLVVSPAHGGMTLWQAVVARWGTWYAEPTVCPGATAILEALEAVNAARTTTNR
ncbi:hypothetical protein [Agromyces larvae]|uniref:Uncharacterized protein n=1 Tax=Agromyces larvae TaxID=2929802 RepID=A0ABY4C389_9MICO|nr:hypothetical protein [Agromyces larvae]UOE45935.1 hypothetical protein MTO99_09400 [Agromyces larvae]